MKRLVPTEFELSLEADREHAARGAAMHKQKPLAVNIQDDKQRIRELEAALKDCQTDPNSYAMKRGDTSALLRRLIAINAHTAAILKGAK